MDKPKLVDRRDVATEYGVSVTTQKVLIDRGEFCPHLRIGNKYYFLRDELEAWLQSQRVVSTPDAAEAIHMEATDAS